MFEDQSMFHFENLETFQKFYRSLIFFGKWRITDQPVNDRGNKVKYSNYMNLLRDKFNDKHLFRRQVSIAELISFVDGFYIMDKFSTKLKDLYGNEVYKNLALFSEYRIKLSKNKRVDFILKMGTKILILEFRISNTFPNLSNIWHRKAYELLLYKEMMSYYLDDDVEIYNYAFIGMAEFGGKNGKEPAKKHIEYNDNNIVHLCEFVKEYLF